MEDRETRNSKQVSVILCKHRGHPREGMKAAGQNNNRGWPVRGGWPATSQNVHALLRK